MSDSYRIAGWVMGLGALCFDVFLMRYVAPFGKPVGFAAQLWK
jgi:hypothetical protein